ncbi:MAG: polyphosphate polymerase domain-containing protein [Lachnospiraceae bacterium]|nr:polyphosphate polymerase domain-containing protein [Lachnospiraceae bacterium]
MGTVEIRDSSHKAGKGEKRVNREERFRHELKYRIGYAQYMELRNRLRTIMQSDVHAGVDGRYLIRSIYFDNYMDKALREKADGVSRREKFRIRYYNDDFSYLTLEKKIKDNALCMKIDAQLTEKECRELLEGRTDWMREHPSPLVRELYAKMHYQMLCPRVLVSYIREPYIYQAGNVRVTFDSDIRTTLYHRNFLEDRVADIDTAAEPRDMILEVKYDAFLPEIIRSLIQINTLRQTAFSKYEACRRFG